MKEHPFKKMSQVYHDKAALYAQIQFEESKVSFLLKKLKLPKLDRELRQRWELETSQNRLTFQAFNDAFPSFPVLLGTTKLDRVHLDARAMLPSLMRNFELAPFVAPYELFYEQNQERADKEGRLIGLIFPRKGIPSGLIIYTSDDLEAIPFAQKELFLSYLSGKGKDRRYLIVRSFGKVLEAIHNYGHGWKP